MGRKISDKKTARESTVSRRSFISLQEAGKYSPYSQEYLSLRARQGKLKAVKRGRNWFTTKEWVREYVVSSSWDEKRVTFQKRTINDEPVTIPEAVKIDVAKKMPFVIPTADWKKAGANLWQTISTATQNFAKLFADFFQKQPYTIRRLALSVKSIPVYQQALAGIFILVIVISLGVVTFGMDSTGVQVAARYLDRFSTDFTPDQIVSKSGQKIKTQVKQSLALIWAKVEKIGAGQEVKFVPLAELSLKEGKVAGEAVGLAENQILDKKLAKSEESRDLVLSGNKFNALMVNLRSWALLSLQDWDYFIKNSNKVLAGWFTQEDVELVEVPSTGSNQVATSATIISKPEEQPVPETPTATAGNQALIVVPAEEGTDTEQLKKEIAKSFSDEVNVLPDESGTSGIIKPIFKEPTDQRYFYVMVPMDGTVAN
ncbi:MAG: hypothetical protein A2240_02070 [Candidatus Jacksonbacteria bacterium RIFOXYA2_FULL_43_12]|nr:MAG: hypothetical protein A2240_02070 [Candidatus Jacksonbacteria bacterium RIFOXYA2_FULL_43_12]